MPKPNTHDPFAPPVPAFPRALLERALPAEQVDHLEHRYEEQTNEDGAAWLAEVQGLDTDAIGALYALPDGDTAELAKLPRPQLVNLSASRGLPTSPNREDLAKALVAYREENPASAPETPAETPAEGEDAPEGSGGQQDGDQGDGEQPPAQEETPGDSGPTTTADGPVATDAVVGTPTPPPANP